VDHRNSIKNFREAAIHVYIEKEGKYVREKTVRK